MKKFVLLFALVAGLSTTLVSCSADDSDIQTTTTQGEFTQDTGGVILPKPTPRPN